MFFEFSGGCFGDTTFLVEWTSVNRRPLTAKTRRLRVMSNRRVDRRSMRPDGCAGRGKPAAAHWPMRLGVTLARARAALVTEGVRCRQQVAGDGQRDPTAEEKRVSMQYRA